MRSSLVALLVILSVAFTACGQKTATPGRTGSGGATTTPGSGASGQGTTPMPPTSGQQPSPKAAASATGALFAQKCAACHGPQGQGGIGPALNTARVTQKYPNQTKLAAFIRTRMPKSNPGSLTGTQASNLAAYIETTLIKGA